MRDVKGGIGHFLHELSNNKASMAFRGRIERIESVARTTGSTSTKNRRFLKESVRRVTEDLAKDKSLNVGRSCDWMALMVIAHGQKLHDAQLKMLDAMIERNVRPTVTAFNIALRSILDIRSKEKSIRVHQFMYMDRVQKNLSLLDKMKAQDVRPNEFTQAAAIRNAIGHSSEMIKKKSRVLDVLDHPLFACADTGKKRSLLSSSGYLIAIAYLADRGGNVSHAETLFDEMVARNQDTGDKRNTEKAWRAVISGKLKLLGAKNRKASRPQWVSHDERLFSSNASELCDVIVAREATHDLIPIAHDASELAARMSEENARVQKDRNPCLKSWHADKLEELLSLMSKHRLRFHDSDASMHVFRTLMDDQRWESIPRLFNALVHKDIGDDRICGKLLSSLVVRGCPLDSLLRVLIDLPKSGWNPAAFERYASLIRICSDKARWSCVLEIAEIMEENSNVIFNDTLVRILKACVHVGDATKAETYLRFGNVARYSKFCVRKNKWQQRGEHHSLVIGAYLQDARMEMPDIINALFRFSLRQDSHSTTDQVAKIVASNRLRHLSSEEKRVYWACQILDVLRKADCMHDDVYYLFLCQSAHIGQDIIGLTIDRMQKSNVSLTAEAYETIRRRYEFEPNEIARSIASATNTHRERGSMDLRSGMMMTMMNKYFESGLGTTATCNAIIRSCGICASSMLQTMNVMITHSVAFDVETFDVLLRTIRERSRRGRLGEAIGQFREAEVAALRHVQRTVAIDSEKEISMIEDLFDHIQAEIENDLRVSIASKLADADDADDLILREPAFLDLSESVLRNYVGQRSDDFVDVLIKCSESNEAALFHVLRRMSVRNVDFDHGKISEYFGARVEELVGSGESDRAKQVLRELEGLGIECEVPGWAAIGLW